MSMIAYWIPFLVVLTTMIFVHELGHFLVAKWLKIKVETFSIGFGPRLLWYKYGDTEYRISAIPLGGYVKMKGENLDEEIEGTGDEFLSRPKWHRFLVLVAGPLMNILTALAIPAGIAMVAFQEPAYLTQPVVVGSVAVASAAERAGVLPGDKIIKWGNISNPTWSQLKDATALNSIQQPAAVTLLRDGREMAVTITPTIHSEGGQQFGESGLFPLDWKQNSVTVQAITPGFPAEAAGLRANDVITKLNGVPVAHFFWFRASIENFEGREVSLDVNRGGQTVNLKITPKRDADGRVILGFMPGAPAPIPMVKQNKSLGEALRYAWDKNWQVLVLTKEAFGQMFSGQRNVRDSLAGPIGIADISAKSYEIGGVEGVLNVMGFLSLNLGVFNLLPIPVLDGGHIFIIFLEALLGLVGLQITAGFKEKLMQTGAIVLLLLMGFVIFNDVAKKFSSRSTTAPPAKTQPAPPPQPAPQPAAQPAPQPVPQPAPAK